MIEESEQLMRTTCVFVCRPYHVRVKPSRRASDRAPFKRVRTPHARPSVLKEPRAKSSCADANANRVSGPESRGSGDWRYDPPPTPSSTYPFGVLAEAQAPCHIASYGVVA